MVRFGIMKHDTNFFRQVLLVLLVVLLTLWRSTEWTIRSPGWLPRPREPLTPLPGMPGHHPRDLFRWYFSFFANAQDAFKLCRNFAALDAIMTATTGFLLWVRPISSNVLYAMETLDPYGMFRNLLQGVHAIAAPQNPQSSGMLIRQKDYYVC